MSAEPKRVLITGAAGDAFGNPCRARMCARTSELHVPILPTLSMPTALHWTTVLPRTPLRPVIATPVQPHCLSGQICYALLCRSNWLCSLSSSSPWRYAWPQSANHPAPSGYSPCTTVFGGCQDGACGRCLPAAERYTWLADISFHP